MFFAALFFFMETFSLSSSCLIPPHSFYCLSKSSFDVSQIDILWLMTDFSLSEAQRCD